MSSPADESSAAARRSRRLEELAFLEEVARLAASTRTWDELMVTVVDRATAAVGAEVCSLYLLDRDGSGVTLAATNGLPRSQIGVARLPLGVGITGRVAESRQAIVSVDVSRDARFYWIPGVDEPRYTSMCSVPLVWNDQVVGVLNVQTVRRRVFRRRDLRFLETLAALLAGIVEKGRLQREAEAQVESLRAIDEARASLVTIVTHDLRTPLAVIRACLELAGAAAREAGTDAADRWEREALEQVDRIDRTIDSILASLRVIGGERPRLSPTVVDAVVDETLGSLAPLLRRHELVSSFTERPLVALASADLLRRILEYLLENAAKYALADGRVEVHGWRDDSTVRLAVTDDGPGIPPDWRESIFEPFVRRDDSARGAGIGLFAARRLARSMGGELRVEDRPHRAGSQFVLDLPAAGRPPAPDRG
ncbi:MAG TPA: ATP-binding protein [Candidatus Limnocylindrales bacterium]